MIHVILHHPNLYRCRGFITCDCIVFYPPISKVIGHALDDVIVRLGDRLGRIVSHIHQCVPLLSAVGSAEQCRGAGQILVGDGLADVQAGEADAEAGIAHSVRADLGGGGGGPGEALHVQIAVDIQTAAHAHHRGLGGAQIRPGDVRAQGQAADGELGGAHGGLHLVGAEGFDAHRAADRVSVLRNAELQVGAGIGGVLRHSHVEGQLAQAQIQAPVGGRHVGDGLEGIIRQHVRAAQGIIAAGQLDLGGEHILAVSRAHHGRGG